MVFTIRGGNLCGKDCGNAVDVLWKDDKALQIPHDRSYRCLKSEFMALWKSISKPRKKIFNSLNFMRTGADLGIILQCNFNNFRPFRFE